MKKILLILLLLSMALIPASHGATGGGLASSTASATYVHKTGDTMTGTLNGTALTLSGTGSMESLFVTGSATISGNATATRFYGDGSTLTGIGGVAGNNTWTGSNTFEAGIWIGTSGTSSIDVSGNFYTSGGIRAGDIYGLSLIDTGFTTNRFLYSGAGGVITDNSAMTLAGSNINISTSLEVLNVGITNSLTIAGTSYFMNEVILDDGVVNSPILWLKDAGDKYFAFCKYDAGEASIYNNEGEIQILPSNDTNDYFSFSTASGNGLLKMVTGDSGDLTIQAEGGNLTLTGAVNIPTTLEANNVGVNTKLYLGNLTATRVPYVGSDKGIIDSGNLVFDGTRLTLLGNIQVGEIHSAWGINTAEASPNTIGTAAQTTFYGIGSNLTGIGGTAGNNTWTGTNTFSNTLTLSGSLCATPSADQTLANDSAVQPNASYVRVVGDGGAVVLDTAPAIADGIADGQRLLIQGTSDANSVQIADNCNCQLADGQSFILGKGDMLELVWDSGDSDWYEVHRSGN